MRSELPEIARVPELAVLSAMAHPMLHVAIGALNAISELPEDQKRLYSDVILAALASAHESSESNMPNKFDSPALHAFGQSYKPPWYFDGRRQGRKEGRKTGREQGFRVSALTLLEAKLPTVTAYTRAALAAVRGEEALKALISALGHAPTPAKVRAVLAAARKQAAARD